MEAIFWVCIVLGVALEIIAYIFYKYIDWMLAYLFLAFVAAMFLSGALWAKNIILTGYWANVWVIFIISIILAIVIPIFRDKRTTEREAHEKKAKANFEAEKYRNELQQAIAGIRNSDKYQAFKTYVEKNIQNIYSVDANGVIVCRVNSDVPFFYIHVPTNIPRIPTNIPRNPDKDMFRTVNQFVIKQGERAWTQAERDAITSLIYEFMRTQTDFEFNEDHRSTWSDAVSIPFYVRKPPIGKRPY